MGMNEYDRDGLLERLDKAVEEGEVETAVELTQEALKSIGPVDILNALQEAMQRVGQLFEDQVLFLPDLYMTAQAMQACSELLRPELKKTGRGKAMGKIVLGTVENDIHDIGKNIVRTVLSANGFEVFDIGINCPADRFIQKALEVDADIVAMSSLLTITMPEMIKVVNALHELKARHPILTLIGGAPVTQAFADHVGADGFAPDAFAAVEAAAELVARKEKAAVDN
jgi:methylmalonyl-CoA mutase cobalamin-binding domain/chain